MSSTGGRDVVTLVLAVPALIVAVMGWLPVAWFTPLAIFSAVASLLGLALFPTAFLVVSSSGVLVVDLAVLAAVVWYHWLPTNLAA